ncbi:MAG: hypothetical protein AAF585_27810, partial [Verrucomicrobiota bacterium]
QLFRIRTPLKAWEVDFYDLNDSNETEANKKVMSEWAEKLITGTENPVLKRFGVIMAGLAWESDSRQLLEDSFDSDDPLMRRAAFFSLGSNDKSAIDEFAITIAGDPSDKVRAVLPQVISEGGNYWIHYFDEEHYARSYQSRSYSNRATRHSEDVLRALRQLTGDTSANVRLESFFALLSAGESPDPAVLEETLNQFADGESLGERIGDYLEDNYAKIDRSNIFLLDYADHDSFSYRQEEIYRHFGYKPKGADEIELAFLNRDPNAVAALTAPGAEVEPVINVAAPVLKLIYFQTPGCDECAKAKRILTRLSNSFPDLKIEEFNVRNADAAHFAEALSERFNVPNNKRLLTPTIFTEAGPLIKEEIEMARLGDLVTQASRYNSDGSWASVGLEARATAQAAIADRFGSINLGLIIGAGLLDGINPCAFATIILFLSYLQIARRRPSEMLGVGLAFIFGVFVTYFVLGLGLFALAEYIQRIQILGLILSYGMAAFVLVIMVLNLRDGVLCLQGRLKDTTLQLPGVIKDRVRAVARKGARHRWWLLAALVSGVIISVLELACTGQVYLPTIQVMVQSGSGLAIWYLLIFNLAFIAPLALIFVLTFFGLRSENLIEFQQKHTAVVKFGTAALFLGLFVFLIWHA